MFRFLVFILVAMLETTALQEESCTVNGYTAKVRDVFTPPGFPTCIHYRCDSGTITTVKDGCNFEAVCIDVDGTYVRKCRTFKCLKSTSGDTSNYRVTIIKTLCQDKAEACRSPRETFEKVLGGKTYAKCSCIVNESTVSYSCFNSLMS